MHFNKIKKGVSELIQVSTAYGLPNVFRSKRLFNKLFWTIYFLLSFIGACYYIFKDIHDYFSYEIVTLVQTEYDQPTEFPTVSFCSVQPNFSSFSSSYLYFSQRTLEKENHLESFMTASYGRCFRFNSGKNMNNSYIAIKNSSSGGGLYSFFFH